METVKDVFAAYRNGLQSLYDVREADAIALTVLKEVTGKSNAYLKAFPDYEITAAIKVKPKEILDQLITGQPLQYVLGHTEFYGLPFKVNPSVLIPRPETEELVDWVLNSDLPPSAINILDIGTGSGCIAISLKKNLQHATVWAIDISATALRTAKENAELNSVPINFVEADVLNLSSTTQNLQLKYDLIISNPPYVTPTDKELMHINVTDFEPHTALFVSQQDPLLFYKAIADLATDQLVKGGLLFFEINESYGIETVSMLTNKGFKEIELRKDMSGRDRMIKAVL
ncbi:peptide chain release factor N(5)-glutamine methyltransferase [Mucilaginibacter sp. HD30]